MRSEFFKVTTEWWNHYIYSWITKHKSAFCFASWNLIFIIFLTILPMDPINIHKIFKKFQQFLNLADGAKYKFIFIFDNFGIFQVDWKTHSQVSRNLLIKFEFTDNDRCTWGSLKSQRCQIAPYFRGGKLVTCQTEKKTVEYLGNYSTDFRKTFIKWFHCVWPF